MVRERYGAMRMRRGSATSSTAALKLDRRRLPPPAPGARSLHGADLRWFGCRERRAAVAARPAAATRRRPAAAAMSVRAASSSSRCPRSGSTLLQRMLAGHPEIATVVGAVDPAAAALRAPPDRGVTPSTATAPRPARSHDFCDVAARRARRYLDEVRRSALALYDRPPATRRWFLDKTPRYHLVVDEIMELFPDARFVFLWRNPLAVAASIIESFGRGHVEPRPVRDRPPRTASSGWSPPRAPTTRRCIRLRYEDVVADPEPRAGARSSSSSGSSRRRDGRTGFAERRACAGRMGDRTGPASYSTVTTSRSTSGSETMAQSAAQALVPALPRARRRRSGWPRWGMTPTTLVRQVDGSPAGPRACLATSPAAPTAAAARALGAAPGGRSSRLPADLGAPAREPVTGRPTPSSSCTSARPAGSTLRQILKRQYPRVAGADRAGAAPAARGDAGRVRRAARGGAAAAAADHGPHGVRPARARAAPVAPTSRCCANPVRLALSQYRYVLRTPAHRHHEPRRE